MSGKCHPRCYYCYWLIPVQILARRESCEIMSLKDVSVDIVSIFAKIVSISKIRSFYFNFRFDSDYVL